MLSLRGGRGVGDTLYVQAIARELCKTEDITVCTEYPELFQLPVKFEPYRRNNIDVVCHYANRRHERTHQWEDVQIRAGVKADLRLDWQTVNDSFIRRFEHLRPILFVNAGRFPMQRTDGYANSILPEEGPLNAVLKELRKEYTAIYVGRGARLYPVECDIDLGDKTSITELVDLATISDAFYGQCSFMNILAQSLDKPCLTMFASRRANNDLLRTITPQKILFKETDEYIFDDLRSGPRNIQGKESRYSRLCAECFG